ncbi:OmcA/MtrC family decaheme c-type cytochrome [Shewanella sp. 0m-4]
MMMNRYKLTSAVKSAIGIGAFAIALIGCGSDGKDGEDGNNGNIGIDIQQATSLKANILHATITEGVVAVDFELLTANGVAVSGLESFDDINALGFGIAKLDALQKRDRPLPGFGSPEPEATPMKGEKSSQWVSYINSIKIPGSIADGQALPEGWDKHQGPQIQANIETSCKTACIEVLAHGEYRYTFSKALNQYEQIEGLDTEFKSELTHRITLELKPTNVVSNATLINTHYDFIPALDREAEADETRNLVDLQESCIRCHNDNYEHAWAPKLSMHGGKRIEIENCAVCHTTYSGDPETGATIDMGSMLHQIHKGQYFMIGYGGKAHDYSEVTFPADAKACQSCHIEGENAPAQAEQFHFHRQEACLSCHEKFAAPEWDGTARGLFHSEQFPQYVERDCAACHADDSNPMGAAKFHLRSELERAIVKQDFNFEVTNSAISFDDATDATLSFTVTFDTALESSPSELSFFKDLNVIAAGSTETDFNNYDRSHKNRKSWNVASSALIESGTVSVKTEDNKSYDYAINSVNAADFGTQNSGSLLVGARLCTNPDSEEVLACDDEGVIFTTINADSTTFGIIQDSRRVVSSDNACQGCHDNSLDITKHHPAKSSSCVACHSPEATVLNNGSFTDGSCASCHTAELTQRHNGRELNNAFDYKVLIHTLHANKRDLRQGSEQITFTKHYGDCASCHDKGQLAMSDTATLPAVMAKLDGENVEYSPIAAACGSCHTKESFGAHVESNGGVFGTPRGTYDGTESCATCHAEGKSFGVDKVHPTNYK